MGKHIMDTIRVNFNHEQYQNMNDERKLYSTTDNCIEIDSKSLIQKLIQNKSIHTTKQN